MLFRECLTSLRASSGLSAQELAKKAGISRITVHNLEAGRRQPSLDMARRLAMAFGASLSIFDRVDLLSQEKSRESV